MLPAFIAKVGAQRVECDARAGVGDAIADGPQERGGPLRLAEHEELIGRPQQRPRHQLRSRTMRRSRPRPAAPRPPGRGPETPAHWPAAAAPPASDRSAPAPSGPVARRASRSPSRSACCAASTTSATGCGASLSSARDASRSRSLRWSRRVLRQQRDQLGAPPPRHPSAAQRGQRPLGEQRVRGVHHRVVGVRVARPGLRRAPVLRLADRAVAGQRGQIGERQRFLDGEIVQHRRGPRAGNSAMNVVDLGGRWWLRRARRRRCGPAGRRSTAPRWPRAPRPRGR